MQAIHRAHHPLHYVVLVWVRSHYEVDFSYHGQDPGRPDRGARTAAGAAATRARSSVPSYARGHYGDIFDSLWIEGAFTLMFLLPLLLLRRRSWLDRLDIAVVLSFGASYWLFDTTHLEAGGVAVLSAAPVPPRPDADQRLPAPRGHRGPWSAACPPQCSSSGLALLIVARIVVRCTPRGCSTSGPRRYSAPTRSCTARASTTTRSATATPTGRSTTWPTPRSSRSGPVTGTTCPRRARRPSPSIC